MIKNKKKTEIQIFGENYLYAFLVMEFAFGNKICL